MHPIVELQQAGSGALRGVDLVVSPGERIGVIGAPGSGKSALVELLAGARRPTTGRVRRDGVDVTDRSEGGGLVRGVGWVSQRARPFRNLTVYENVLAVSLANPSWSNRVAEAHARRAVVRVGLSGVADQLAATLDPVLAKRLEVARVLAAPQRLVLVDQLSDGLDPVTRMELSEALTHAVKEGAAVVWADVLDAPPVAVDRLIVLALGRIEAEGTPERILGSPLLRDLRNVAEPSRGPTGVRRSRPAASVAVDGAAAPVPALKVSDWTAPEGEAAVVRDVSFQVDKGEIVAVWGRPGSGKSVLLRSIAGLMLARGDLEVDGVDLSGLPSFARSRRGLRLVPQHGGFSPGLSVSDNLALARDLGRAGPWSIPGVYDLFPGLYDGRSRPAAELAELERRALVLGNALLCQPKVLLIDELTDGLAARSADLFLQSVLEISAQVACVVAERAGGPALSIAQRTAELRQGQWHEDSSERVGP